MTGYRIVVRGQVQGVGFRAYAYREATYVGLRGSVWNRSDGGVEIVAYAEVLSTLDSFVLRLQQGPGRIDSVEVDSHVGEPPSNFDIGPTR